MLQFICCLLISLTHCSGLDHETTPGMLHLTHLLVYASLFQADFLTLKLSVALLYKILFCTLVYLLSFT